MKIGRWVRAVALISAIALAGCVDCRSEAGPASARITLAESPPQGAVARILSELGWELTSRSETPVIATRSSEGSKLWIGWANESTTYRLDVGSTSEAVPEAAEQALSPHIEPIRSELAALGIGSNVEYHAGTRHCGDL